MFIAQNISDIIYIQEKQKLAQHTSLNHTGLYRPVGQYL